MKLDWVFIWFLFVSFICGLLLSDIVLGYDPTEEALVIKTIMLEAEDQGLEGMIAVGEVIRNRALERSQTLTQVVMAPKQFSCHNEPKKAQERLSGMSATTWQMASKAWNESESTNYTKKANLYYNPKLASPSWAKSPKVKHTVTIKDHVFMREER